MGSVLIDAEISLFFFAWCPVSFVREVIPEFAGLRGPDLSAAHDSSSFWAVSVAPVAQLSLPK